MCIRDRRPSFRRSRARAEAEAEAEGEVPIEAGRVTALCLVLLLRAPASLLPRSNTRRQPLRVGEHPRDQQRARVPLPVAAVAEGTGSELHGAVQLCRVQEVSGPQLCISKGSSVCRCATNRPCSHQFAFPRCIQLQLPSGPCWPYLTGGRLQAPGISS